MLRAVLIGAVFVCANTFAASNTPSFTGKLTLGVRGTPGGSSLTIKGKSIDLYSLWNLSATATGKRVLITMTEELGVFTSNGNVRVFFFSNDKNNTITTNGNLFKVVYTVKVDKKGNAIARNDKSTAKIAAFQANKGDPSKSTFKFVFTGAQVDSAAALLPKGGKKNLPTLAGTTDFTLQIGSSKFVEQPDSRGNVKP